MTSCENTSIPAWGTVKPLVGKKFIKLNTPSGGSAGTSETCLFKNDLVLQKGQWHTNNRPFFQ